jgi:hypothetical protein
MDEFVLNELDRVPDEFNYVDIVGKGCEGWINLFFGDVIITLIRDVDLANEIKIFTKRRNNNETKQTN